MSELRLYHTDKYAGNIANKAAADGSNKLYHTDKYAGNIADLYLSLLKCLYYSRFFGICQPHFFKKCKKLKLFCKIHLIFSKNAVYIDCPPRHRKYYKQTMKRRMYYENYGTVKKPDEPEYDA